MQHVDISHTHAKPFLNVIFEPRQFDIALLFTVNAVLLIALWCYCQFFNVKMCTALKWSVSRSCHWVRCVAYTAQFNYLFGSICMVQCLNNVISILDDSTFASIDCSYIALYYWHLADVQLQSYPEQLRKWKTSMLITAIQKCSSSTQKARA